MGTSLPQFSQVKVSLITLNLPVLSINSSTFFGFFIRISVSETSTDIMKLTASNYILAKLLRQLSEP